MRVIVEQNISAASAAVDQVGPAVSGGQLFALSAQAVVTGTSTGTLTIQFSNDVINPMLPPFVPTNWSSTTQTVAIAGAGKYAIPKFDVCYGYIRASFAHGNGAAGTITVTLARAGA